MLGYKIQLLIFKIYPLLRLISFCFTVFYLFSRTGSPNIISDPGTNIPKVYHSPLQLEISLPFLYPNNSWSPCCIIWHFLSRPTITTLN